VINNESPFILVFGSSRSSRGAGQGAAPRVG
jgi:hypothetical protein